MGNQLEKAKARLLSEPNDYTFAEAKKLLMSLGYREYNKGRTSVSRVMFVHDNGAKILLHKPHPGNEMKRYAVRQLAEHLRGVWE